ncbi:MAG: hypothetical protein V4525_03540 [Pseudomonadota bacterium]
MILDTLELVVMKYLPNKIVGSLSEHLIICIGIFIGMLLTRAIPQLFALLMLTGTIAHEAMHYAVGFLLFAKPSSFSVLPRRAGRHWILGEVTFARLRWWNKLPVSLAPLLLVPLSWQLLCLALHYESYEWQSLVLKFLCVQWLIASWPSPRDFYHALMAVIVMGGIVAVSVLVGWGLHGF